MFHADWLAEIANLLVAFRNFAKAPKKYIEEFFKRTLLEFGNQLYETLKEREPYLPN